MVFNLCKLNRKGQFAKNMYSYLYESLGIRHILNIKRFKGLEEQQEIRTSKINLI